MGGGFVLCQLFFSDNVQHVCFMFLDVFGCFFFSTYIISFVQHVFLVLYVVMYLVCLFNVCLI